MTRTELIQNALFAVNRQYQSAQKELATVKPLKHNELLAFWKEQTSDLKATYNGLLALLVESMDAETGSVTDE